MVEVAKTESGGTVLLEGTPIVKSGVKTSEFYMGVASLVCGSLLVLLGQDEVAREFGQYLALLGVGGYTASRTVVKM